MVGGVDFELGEHALGDAVEQCRPQTDSGFFSTIGSQFSANFGAAFADVGVRILRSPPKAANANTCAERWISAASRQCLDLTGSPVLRSGGG
jgi:hypothetical protein